MVEKTNTGRGNRRPELLAAAQQLFFKHGYAGATVEHVARAAGLSKRTVYLYFKNKDELFLAVAEQGLLKLRTELEGLSLDELSIKEAIEIIIRVYLDFAHKEPEFFRMIFREASAEMVAAAPAEMRARLEEHEHACLGLVARIVDQAVAQGMMPPIDSWETAVMFWGMVTGIILLSLGGSQTVFGRRTREEIIYKAVWIFYEGLKKPGGYHEAFGGKPGIEPTAAGARRAKRSR
jgi:AcrR family transcriptional regulator